MASFQIGISPNRRRAARFISHVRRTLQTAFAEEQKKTGITQADIARELGVHRSVICRELLGRRDISLGRVAEYAWILGRDIAFDLPIPRKAHGDNRPADPGFVQRNRVWHPITSASSATEVRVEITTSPQRPLGNFHA